MYVLCVCAVKGAVLGVWFVCAVCCARCWHVCGVSVLCCVYNVLRRVCACVPCLCDDVCDRRCSTGHDVDLPLVQKYS